MPPRRLLTLGHSYAVGMNRCLLHAMRLCGGERWEVRALAPVFFHGKNDLRPVRFVPSSEDAGSVTAVPARFTRFVHVFYYGRQLRELLQDNWDVVHAWEEPYIVAGAQIARHVPRASQFVFRTAQSIDKRYPPPFCWLENAAVRRADGWICSGNLVSGMLNSRKAYAEKPHRIIPLGVDLAVFQQNREAGTVRLAELNWSRSGPPVIGYLGRFVAEKGIGFIRKVLQGLATPWRALFVGDGPLLPELLRWQSEMPDRVRIVSGVVHDDVPGYLNAMDVMVAPSQTTPKWREQFGRMIVEAMACGVPVVGSDSGEIPFVVGDSGIVLPEADIAAWTNRLAELLESPRLLAEMAQRGLQRAATDFAWPIVAKQHLRFFDELLDIKARRQ